MSQGKYPIQQYLRRLIPPFESCRNDFVQKLGYRNLELGRLHLDSWLDRGEGYLVFLSEVAAAYPAARRRIGTGHCGNGDDESGGR